MRSRFSLLWLLPLLVACDQKKANPAAVSPPQTPVAPVATPPAASAASAPPEISSASASAAAPSPELLLDILIPASVGADRRPLVIFLHGLGNTGKSTLKLLGIPEVAQEKRFVYAAPEGAMSSLKAQYWNASKACCDFDQAHLDHVGMLRRAISRAKTHPNVDPAHVYLVGFSNGGFFAHRAACEIEDVSAIASIAGVGPADGEACAPAHPVRVLQIHGDADKAVRYEGGRVLDKSFAPLHPGAKATVDAWAQRNGCSGAAAAAGTMDFEEKIEGAETSVSRFAGCKAAVELWTVKGGTHYLAANKKAVEAVWAFLDRGGAKQ